MSRFFVNLFKIYQLIILTALGAALSGCLTTKKNVREMNKYVYGTPSAEESNLLWLSNSEEVTVDGNDYEKASFSLEKHLAKRYDLGSENRLGVCYVRGDFYGDRTQYLEVYDEQIITVEFLKYVQEWIASYEPGGWRVVILTYSEEAAIMIYESCVRFNKELELMSTDDAILYIRNRMQ